MLFYIKYFAIDKVYVPEMGWIQENLMPSF